MPDRLECPTVPRRRLRDSWPVFIVALMVVPAIRHVVDFPEAVDREFPVVRPTFNRMPPPAYRLAEPGDTLDRVGLYLSAAAVVVSGIGLIRSKDRRGYWRQCAQGRIWIPRTQQNRSALSRQGEPSHPH